MGGAGIWLVLIFSTAWLFSHVLFRAGLTLSPVELLLAPAMAAVAAVVYRFVAADKHRRLFRRAFALFVGHRVATSLEETQTIALSGTRQLVTIMFTDIRGFTSFCEEKDPASVVGLLNDYMSLMVSIIVSHRGHVNKFIGDGILAVFSDNDGTTPGDHAQRAVRCAVQMVSAESHFRTGAGIHTGMVVVGNVGSADKMEYTVLGDTVNLAARLESLNKEYKTEILLSQTTCEMAGESMPFKPLGQVGVRGKTLPVGLYTVASLPPLTHDAPAVGT
jgi:adenylate cyclase